MTTPSVNNGNAVTANSQPSNPTKERTPFSYEKGTPLPPQVAAQAKQVAKSRAETTNPIQPPSGVQQQDLAIIQLTDVQLGKLLGEGSYSTAYEIELKSNKENSSTSETRKWIIKQLSPKVRANPLMFAACASDLVQEGQILHLVGKSHPNILDIHGWSGANMVDDYLRGNPDNCQLVLEQLTETLEDKIKHWQAQSASLWYMLYEETNTVEHLDTLKDKCAHTMGLAKALEHLHRHNVLHRDLKPANIGFNQEGVLKVFDFDLARVLPSPPKNGRPAFFHMTSRVGSPRYMAPEVKVQEEPYNCLADVYSFGVLVYQVLTLETPLSSTVRDWSTNNKYVPKEWSLTVREVMGKSLLGADQVEERPSMSQVVSAFDQCSMLKEEGNTTQSDKEGTVIQEDESADVAIDNCCTEQSCADAPVRKGWFW